MQSTDIKQYLCKCFAKLKQVRLQSPDERSHFQLFNASLNINECVVAPHNVIHIQNKKAIAVPGKVCDRLFIH
ncbi:MAG: hypothetical protein KAF91_32225 [Nostoc sp. TH1S01]|nr:hypothetical protein [Nostoc sp. TH1S01]